MNRDDAKALLARLRNGEVREDEVLDALTMEPFLEAGTAKIDVRRHTRRGLPEVVYCKDKAPAQVATIFATMAGEGLDVLGTRASREHAAATRAVVPDARYDEVSGLLRVTATRGDRSGAEVPAARIGRVAVVSAGSADEKVLAEAAGCLDAFGHDVVTVTDVGVAGLQRIAAHVPLLNDMDVVIVVAGMDGALPSVVGGLLEAPVIAVPTSVGYGAAFGGLSALLAMLNSCAGGVTVVNIDNGFGAAYAASLIVRRMTRRDRTGGEA